MSSKRILVIGSGGREHAICWKLSQSPEVAKIYCAPGNGGTAHEAKTENLALDVDDFDGLIAFAQSEKIDLTIVGPDNPLAGGIVDAFQVAGLSIFGPTQSAARLESSKVFAKQFMQTHNLLTAPFEVFNNAESAFDYCVNNRRARVIKVDGLALGKGVYVCETLKDCELALNEIFEEGRFGASGAQVVIEERLYGPEISLMVLCDGKTLLPLTSSQDYKRRFEGNKGPNTGGMGAYSPVPLYEAFESVVEEQVLGPLKVALGKTDFVFQGVLFIGLMMHHNRPHILEFNARFGDPETQCILPRLENDLLPLLEACVKGTLSEHTLQWSPQASTCVVLCADTYPAKGSNGTPIALPNPAENAYIFHAGTKHLESGPLVTAGGRILNIVSLAERHEQAAAQAYSTINEIQGEGLACRSDIAKDISVCHLK